MSEEAQEKIKGAVERLSSSVTTKRNPNVHNDDMDRSAVDAALVLIGQVVLDLNRIADGVAKIAAKMPAGRT